MQYVHLLLYYYYEYCFIDVLIIEKIVQGNNSYQAIYFNK